MKWLMSTFSPGVEAETPYVICKGIRDCAKHLGSIFEENYIIMGMLF